MVDTSPALFCPDAFVCFLTQLIKRYTLFFKWWVQEVAAEARCPPDHRRQRHVLGDLGVGGEALKRFLTPGGALLTERR